MCDAVYYTEHKYINYVDQVNISVWGYLNESYN